MQEQAGNIRLFLFLLFATFRSMTTKNYDQ